jgi:hypothetical protein
VALERLATRALVGFAEALAAPEAAWSLVDAGFEVVAFARAGARPPLRASAKVRLVEITAPEHDALAASDDVRTLARSLDADVVMPLDDWSVHIVDAALGDAGPVVGPTGEQARFALDKRLQLRAARVAGFNVPPTRELDDPAALLDGTTLPAVVKPALAVVTRAGRLARAPLFVCGDQRELQATVRALPPEEPVLVQPLLDGVGEGLFGLVTTRGPSAWSAHRRIRMMNPQGSGSSACASIDVDAGLAAAAGQLLAATAWRGLFMVELLRDRAGQAWFVELNGRPWGSLALARRRGLEYPAWAARAHLDAAFVPPVHIADGAPVTCRHLGREVLHLLFVLRGPRSAALAQQWPGRVRSVMDLLHVRRSDRWYNWRRDEARVFVADTLRTLSAVAPR